MLFFFVEPEPCQSFTLTFPVLFLLGPGFMSEVVLTSLIVKLPRKVKVQKNNNNINNNNKKKKKQNKTKKINRNPNLLIIFN